MNNLLNGIKIFISRYWIACTLLILTAITLLSLYPAEHLPEVPGTDKTHHFIAYAVLIFPLALARPKFWPVYGLMLLGWSGMIELLQPYVNRYGEWLDLLANAIGLICGILLAQVFSWVTKIK